MATCNHHPDTRPARISSRRLLSRAWTCALLAALPGTAAAQLQLTDSSSGDSRFPSLSADGSRVVFQSTANLDGDNADGSDDIFVVDSSGDNLRQISDTTQGAIEGSISGDGGQLLFASNSNPNGDNADGNVELFLAGADGSGLSQLTQTTGISGIQQARLSRDGGRVVFVASANITGDNPDGSLEIFVIDTAGGEPLQLTDGPSGSSAQFPTLSPDASQVVFSSNANPAGANADGNTEIFLVAADGSEAPSQITDTVTGQSLRPSMSASGRILFESTANPDGSNADGNTELFIVNSDGSGLTPLTNTVGGSNGFGRISADDSRAVFQSNVNYTGDNSDGSVELFLVDTDTGDITQLTNSALVAEQADISADGALVVYQSAGGSAGDNPEGNSEIFLINTDGSTPPGGGAGGDDDDDGDRSDEFGCFFAGSGCSLCQDDDSSSGNSSSTNETGGNGTDMESDNDEGNDDQAFNARRAQVIRADPTLTLLVMVGAAGVWRRRR